jgi:Icc protein
MFSYRLAWVSDLHFDSLFANERARFIASLRQLKANALVVTGDISTSRGMGDALAVLAEMGMPVYFVTGNHDYYCGSFAETDAQISAICQAHPRLARLGQGEIVPLTNDSVLVGHGGWGDGQAGLGIRTPLWINDAVFIDDLKLQKEKLFARLKQLGEDSARYMERVLPIAITQGDHVIIATHVPPFAEAARHDGRPASPDYLPYYVNVTLGETLLKFTAAWPNKRFTVLAGHTHEACDYRASDNLWVRVAGAVYGRPKVEAILSL